MGTLEFWQEVGNRAAKDWLTLMDIKILVFGLAVWAITAFALHKPGEAFDLKQYFGQGLVSLSVAALACSFVLAVMFIFHFPAVIYSETARTVKTFEAENAQLKDAKNAVPVIHFNLNHEMILTLENRGPVGVEDIRLFQTSYTVALNPARITQFNKAGGPIQRHEGIAPGSSWSADLKISPFKFVQTDSDDYYLYRVTFRHAITKQKYVHHIVVSAIQGLPNPFQPDERVATAGVYRPPQEGLFSLQTAMREHNAFIFGDDKSLIYRN
jgi:hypothetical protein